MEFILPNRNIAIPPLGSNFHDALRMPAGKIRLDLFDHCGGLKERREFDNLVVGSGKCALASRARATATAVPTHMSVGTNNTAATSTDVALGAEVASSRTALTSTIVVNNILTYICTFPAGTGTGALVEAGLFNGTTAAATALSYTRSGSVVTVTKTSHGLAVDRAIGISAATDTGLNGGATIATVPDANTFTFSTSAVGANGTLTLYQDVMSCRTVFSVINKGASDSMTITWTLTFS